MWCGGDEVTLTLLLQHPKVITKSFAIASTLPKGLINEIVKDFSNTCYPTSSIIIVKDANFNFAQ